MPKKINKEEEKTKIATPKKTTKTAAKKDGKSTTTKKPATRKASVKKEPISATEKVEINNETILKVNKQKEETTGFFEILLAFVVVALIGGMIGFSARGKVDKGYGEDYTVVNEELQKFIEQYNYILDNYYGDIDKNELIANAISGMLSSLDMHSIFIDNTSNSQMITLEGKYEGMGVEIYNDNDGNIVVLTVFEDSAAFEAGIKPNDILVSLDGQDLVGKKTSEFVAMFKNIKNKEIKLGIKRENKNLEVTVSRRTVVLKSVKSQMIGNIGYIDIDIFADNTDEQFKEALNELESRGMKSLIIDVRGNSGGHLRTVENMLYEFLDSSHVIYQTESNTERNVIYSKGSKTKEYPIVILMNENSASASEILAATLSEELGAYLIGNTTYGKGTVQELRTINGVGQYKFTTKKWLTPKGNWIDGIGVVPNLKVDLDNEYYNNPTQENDNQLKSAIEHLNNLKD